jgi:NodT family efflux transporter outer membrane factor (OMF) lipoprotein
LRIVELAVFELRYMCRPRTMRLPGCMAALAWLFTAACVVGPKFKKPAPPDVGGYTPTPITSTSATTSTAGGEAQHLVDGQDIPGEWWALFHSKALSDLIERSLKANPNLKSAQAALAVAKENVLAQRGFYYPNVTGSFTATRARSAADLSPILSTNVQNYTLYTPEVSVSFVPDVFGLNRRTVESLEAQAQQARFALIATYITLSSNIATGAIEEASLRGQVTVTNELITINTGMLKTLREQYGKGYASELDVRAQESQLAQFVATLPPLLKLLAQQRDALAVMAGAYPKQDVAEKFELADLQLPQELPLSLPSKLVEQRPDVRQAEENLHSASAQIGIAIANRLPTITLSADGGSAPVDITKMFSSGNGFWDVTAGITQPIFDAGTLKHRERAAKAAYTEAAEQYRSTVLTAFQNVADTLHALYLDADALKAAASAKNAATVSLELAKKQYGSGYSSYLALLSAEQAYQQALSNLVQAQANRYTDTAALFQALGGGWWNRPDVPKN